MFYERLKELRKAYNYSQVQVANKIGVKKQTFANWERDNILPSVDKLIKVAEFFHVPTDYLLGLDNRHFVDVSDISLETAAHIQLLINDLSLENKIEEKQKKRTP